MNFKDLRRPFLRWAMGWPGDSTRFGPPRLPPAKMVQVAEESKNELPELIPVHPEGKIFRNKVAIPIGCKPHPAFDIPVAPQTPTYLARVPRGRVLGPTVAVLTSGDRMLSDVSLDWGRPGAEHYAYRRFRVPRCKDYQGSALVLACTGSDTYYHWLTDALPRLEIFAKALGTGKAPDWWVVNTINRPFIRESLALLGIPLGRVVALDKMPHVRFSELYVPSLPCESSSGDAPPWIGQYLQSIFASSKRSRESSYEENIFIDRSNSSTRRLILTAEDTSFLKKRGFSIVKMELLPIQKQFFLARNAGRIVGPHGAGFTNIVFSNKAKVLEFFKEDYVNACYYSVSQLNSLDYSYHIQLQTFGSSKHQLKLNTDALDRFLKNSSISHFRQHPDKSFSS